MWEEIATVRIDATHVSASVYHFSKWAVFDIGDTLAIEVSAEEVPEFEEAMLIIEGEETVSEGSLEGTGENQLTWWQKIVRFFRNLFK